jgi:hypothetical protein
VNKYAVPYLSGAYPSGVSTVIRTALKGTPEDQRSRFLRENDYAWHCLFAGGGEGGEEGEVWAAAGWVCGEERAGGLGGVVAEGVMARKGGREAVARAIVCGIVVESGGEGRENGKEGSLEGWSGAEGGLFAGERIGGGGGGGGQASGGGADLLRLLLACILEQNSKASPCDLEGINALPRCTAGRRLCDFTGNFLSAAPGEGSSAVQEVIACWNGDAMLGPCWRWEVSFVPML